VRGLGDERLSPGVAQVVCEQAQQDSVAAASARVPGSLGAYVAAETVRRVAEEVGRLIEHDHADRQQWVVPAAEVPACLVVATAGVHTPLLEGSHETNVGRVAALGPAVPTDPQTGRATLVLHSATFCTGLAGVAAFLPRLRRAAVRAGFGRGVRQLVLLGDGATWILPHLESLFTQPGVAVIAIVDFYHATEHLAAVAAAVYGHDSRPARPWLAEQRHALLHQGATPVLRALAAFTGLDEQAADVVRRTHDYVATRAACLDYPRFIARHLPSGSGAVARACTTLISQREKGPGMRWTAAGAQHLAQVRALWYSAHARWEGFWATRPLARLRLRPPPAAAPAASAAAPPATAPPPEGAAAAPPPAPSAPLPTAAPRIATAGKPYGKGKAYWRRNPICHQRSA